MYQILLKNGSQLECLRASSSVYTQPQFFCYSVVDANAGYLSLPHGVDAPPLVRPHVPKLERFVLPATPPPAVIAFGLAVGINLGLFLVVVVIRRPEPVHVLVSESQR